jgi:signal transduction histidine kinase
VETTEGNAASRQPTGGLIAFRRWIGLLLGPAEAIRDIAERRRARWLAGLLLLMLAAFGTLDTFYLLTTPGYTPPWYGYLLLGSAYALVRSGRYRTGAFLTIAMIPTVAIMLVATQRSASPRTTLSFLVLAIMLASALLPGAMVALLTVMELVALTLLHRYGPSLPGGAEGVVGPAVLVAIGGGIAYVGAMLQSRVEQDRQGALVSANEALEERVRSRTAELEAANSELEAFAYSASHDLRTPLRAIDSHAAMLAQDEGEHLGESSKRSLQRIRATTARMTELVDRMLELSRVNRAELRLDALDLSKISRDVAEELRASQPDHDVSLVVPDELSARGDPALVRIALSNLLQNAWKFTSGRPSPRVEVSARQSADGAVTYSVKDNGVGFDPRLKDKLFRPFQRLHRADEFAGNGIGTAIVARVIERHGGRVWADSTVGEGAVFYFTLGSPARSKARI